MKSKFFMMMVFVAVIASTACGQMIKRTDAIWARATSGTMVLDGKLNEADWAVAESIKIVYGQDAGMPGSGWHDENGVNPPVDPTNATLKFLVKGDTLWVGVVAKDKSIGAGLFNQFDGLLASMRYRQPTGYLPNPINTGWNLNMEDEIFYAWCSETWADTQTAFANAVPAFLGQLGSPQYVHPRPDSLKAFWDAATTVQGKVNSDTTQDTSWTTEMRFGLKKFGYDVTQVGGDVVMFSMSIYDADWRWPIDTTKAMGNRTWLQCPWGNTAVNDHMRIFANPSVTTTSGPVPTVAADYTIPGAGTYASPTLDGKLTEAVWKNAPGIQLQYGNNAIRNAYPNTLKYRSGQQQPTVNGGLATVLDPNLATVKYFYKADTLFLGFDVNDKVVQYSTNSDRWDGFRITLNDRTLRDPGDHDLIIRSLTFIVDSAGHAMRKDDLATWDTLQQAAQVVLALKGGTTVDTLGTSADSGYTAEMKIVLPKFGYASGRGDGVLFLGITHFDGDSFTPASNSYGTRVWFGRGDNGNYSDGPAWMYMDPSATVTSVASKGGDLPGSFALLGNYPNPFNPATTIKFQIDRSSEVTLEVFDVLGRLVASRNLGITAPGAHTANFNAANLASGTYYYRLKMVSTGSTLTGKMLLLK
ncbi:MAG TPA: T9SS type A sorting domain-containing protein [Bacteroidota bacterium]|nr:T9SS type A sorting domain-containing protein [Bacteroidota bacterium]